MKVLLLKNGGYVGLSRVDFPVVVACRLDHETGGVFISQQELLRVGGNEIIFQNPSMELFFSLSKSDIEYI